MSTITLPAGIVSLVRTAAIRELGGHAQEIELASIERGREQHPEWFAPHFERFDAYRALLGRVVLAETTTREGVRVVLFEDTWLLPILNPDGGHAELEPYLKGVLEVVESSEHRESDDWPYRERFFKRDVGPSRWLMVVVDYEQEPARIVTALGYRHGRSPDGWTA